MQVHVVAPSAFGRLMIGPASSSEESTNGKSECRARVPWRLAAIRQASLRRLPISAPRLSRATFLPDRQQLVLMSCIPH